MKILALIGSPRKGSNTDILVDQILLGARLWGMQLRSSTFMIMRFCHALTAGDASATGTSVS